MLLASGTTITKFSLSATREFQSWDQRGHASEEVNSKQLWAKVNFPSLIPECSLHGHRALLLTTQPVLLPHPYLRKKHTTSSETFLSPTRSSCESCPRNLHTNCKSQRNISISNLQQDTNSSPNPAWISVPG